MVGITIKTIGMDEVVKGLNTFGAEGDKALQRGIAWAAEETDKEAHKLLTGPKTPAGHYPGVNVKTGWLRDSLDFVPPGKTKSGGGLTWTAGTLQAKVYNSAQYSRVIHEGKGSSEKYGKRPFLTDALDKVLGGGLFTQHMSGEVDEALKESFG